jgi:hypothetical protein
MGMATELYRDVRQARREILVVCAVAALIGSALAIAAIWLFADVVP